MTTDRELLEAAARAAGLESMGFDDGVGLYPAGMVGPWNPLTDDGDALRLAVKLRIFVEFSDALLVANANTHLEAFGSDPYAATRRAITHAAAAIGAQR